MFDCAKVSSRHHADRLDERRLPGLGDDISFGQCVSEMALAGFEGCSVGHKYPKDPEVLQAELSRRGLRVSEPWSSTFFTVRDMRERTIEGFCNSMALHQADGRHVDVVVAELGHAVHQRPSRRSRTSRSSTATSGGR